MCDGVMLARPSLYNVSIFQRGVDETTRGGGGADGDDRPAGEEGHKLTTATAMTTMPLPTFQTTEHS